MTVQQENRTTATTTATATVATNNNNNNNSNNININSNNNDSNNRKQSNVALPYLLAIFACCTAIFFFDAFRSARISCNGQWAE